MHIGRPVAFGLSLLQPLAALRGRVGLARRFGAGRLSLLTQPASARLSLRLAPLASPLGPRFSLGLAASGAAAPDRIGGVGGVLSRLRESLLSAGLRFRGTGLHRRSENPRQRIGGALRVSLRLGGGGRLGRLYALPRLLHLLTVVGAVGVALAIDFVADQLRLGAAERGPKGNRENSEDDGSSLHQFTYSYSRRRLGSMIVAIRWPRVDSVRIEPLAERSGCRGLGRRGMRRPASSLAEALLLFIKQAVGSRDQANAGVRRAVSPKPLCVLVEPVEVEDGRVVLISVVAIHPRQHDADPLVASGDEILACDGREIEHLRGSRRCGKKGQRKDRSANLFHGELPRL